MAVYVSAKCIRIYRPMTTYTSTRLFDMIYLLNRKMYAKIRVFWVAGCFCFACTHNHMLEKLMQPFDAYIWTVCLCILMPSIWLISVQFTDFVLVHIYTLSSVTNDAADAVVVIHPYLVSDQSFDCVPMSIHFVCNLFAGSSIWIARCNCLPV